MMVAVQYTTVITYVLVTQLVHCVGWNQERHQVITLSGLIHHLRVLKSTAIWFVHVLYLFLIQPYSALLKHTQLLWDITETYLTSPLYHTYFAGQSDHQLYTMWAKFSVMNRQSQLVLYKTCCSSVSLLTMLWALKRWQFIIPGFDLVKRLSIFISCGSMQMWSGWL